MYGCFAWMHVCAPLKFLLSLKARWETWIPWNWVPRLWATGCQELNLGPQKEQPMLWPTKPSLQAQLSSAVLISDSILSVPEICKSLLMRPLQRLRSFRAIDLHGVCAGCVALSYFMLSSVLHESPVRWAGKTSHPVCRDWKTTAPHFSLLDSVTSCQLLSCGKHFYLKGLE